MLGAQAVAEQQRTSDAVLTTLVYRDVDVNDRRVVRVYLSRRGHAMYRRTAVKIGEVECACSIRQVVSKP